MLNPKLQIMFVIFTLLFITVQAEADDMHAAWGDKVDADYKHAPKSAYENWRDLKYGMRIHWGVYSQLGLDASWPTYQASDEFKMIYNTLWQVFNPTEFDAEEWAELAEESGFKYFVFTTKHADGFCMFDTKTKVKAYRRKPIRRDHVPGISEIEECYISYSIMDTPFKRDVTRELVDAFRNRGLGVGLYYTNADWFDWDTRWDCRHQNYDPSYTLESDPEGYAQAVARQREQLQELTTKYGPIQQFGFDCGWPKSLWPETIKLIKTVRKNQPEALFRQRGLGPYGDYQTPEHWVPDTPDDPRLSMPWQAIEQLGTRWAYQPNDNYRPKEWILNTLIETVAKGGNFMVGVSPTSTGKFPEETIKRLRWAGKWLKVNGEAIYGTRPWKYWAQGDYIRFSQSKDEKYVYAIVLKWPGDEIKIDKLIAKKNSKIIMLGYNDSSRPKPLRWSQNNDGLRILIPYSLQAVEKRPCEFAWVFRIEQ